MIKIVDDAIKKSAANNGWTWEIATLHFERYREYLLSHPGFQQVSGDEFVCTVTGRLNGKAWRIQLCRLQPEYRSNKPRYIWDDARDCAEDAWDVVKDIFRTN